MESQTRSRRAVERYARSAVKRSHRRIWDQVNHSDLYHQLLRSSVTITRKFTPPAGPHLSSMPLPLPEATTHRVAVSRLRRQSRLFTKHTLGPEMAMKLLRPSYSRQSKYNETRKWINNVRLGPRPAGSLPWLSGKMGLQAGPDTKAQGKRHNCPGAAEMHIPGWKFDAIDLSLHCDIFF